MLDNIDLNKMMKVKQVGLLLPKVVGIVNSIHQYYKSAILYIIIAIVLYSRYDYRLIAISMLVMNVFTYLIETFWSKPEYRKFVDQCSKFMKEITGSTEGHKVSSSAKNHFSKDLVKDVTRIIGWIAIPLILYYWFGKWDNMHSREFAITIMFIFAINWVILNIFRAILQGNILYAVSLLPIYFIFWKLKIVNRDVLLLLLLIGTIYYSITAVVLSITFKIEKYQQKFEKIKSSD